LCEWGESGRERERGGRERGEKREEKEKKRESFFFYLNYFPKN